jgi:hypothetical protein
VRQSCGNDFLPLALCFENRFEIVFFRNGDGGLLVESLSVV